MGINGGYQQLFCAALYKALLCCQVTDVTDTLHKHWCVCVCVCVCVQMMCVFFFFFFAFFQGDGVCLMSLFTVGCISMCLV